MKKRFKIFIFPWFFKLQAQILVVQALYVLHNILVNIEKQDPDKKIELEEPENNNKVIENIQEI
jgi:hypothetical protein